MNFNHEISSQGAVSSTILSPIHTGCKSATVASQLKKAIRNNLLAEITNLCQQSPNLLSEPFPNGDFPLVFALKHGNEEVVKVLVQLGANPLQMDSQGINAIGYAKIANDNKMLGLMINLAIDNDINVSQELIQNETLLKKAVATITEIRHLTNSKNTKLTPTQASILNTPSNSIFDSNAALRFEIDQQGNSLFHFASASGNLNTMETCLNGLDASQIDKYLNLPNHQGLTPLHFAAAKENLKMIRFLISKGAKMQARDHNSLTPIALMGAEAYQKNPLNITRVEKFLFIATLVCWGAQLAAYVIDDDALAYSIHQKIEPVSALLGLITFFNSAETWEGAFSFYALPILGAVLSPSLRKNFNLLLTAIKTVQVAVYSKKIYSTTKTCLKNTYLGKSKALFKAIVSCTPKIKAISVSIEHLKLQAKIFGLIDFSQCDHMSGIGTSRSFSCNRLDSKRIPSCDPWISEPIDSECDEAFRAHEKYIEILGLTNHPKPCEVLNNFEGCAEAIQNLNKNCNEGFSQACLHAVKNFDMLKDGKGPEAISRALDFFGISKSETSLDDLKKIVKLAEAKYRSISLNNHPDKTKDLNEAQKIAAEETFINAGNMLKTIREYMSSKTNAQTTTEE